MSNYKPKGASNQPPYTGGQNQNNPYQNYGQFQNGGNYSQPTPGPAPSGQPYPPNSQKGPVYAQQPVGYAQPNPAYMNQAGGYAPYRQNQGGYNQPNYAQPNPVYAQNPPPGYTQYRQNTQSPQSPQGYAQGNPPYPQNGNPQNGYYPPYGNPQAGGYYPYQQPQGQSQGGPGPARPYPPSPQNPQRPPAGQGKDGKVRHSLPIEPDLLVVLASAIVLVVLFILSMAMGALGVKIAFIACAVLFSAFIWLRPVLETGPKMTTTVLLVAAVLVTVLSMVLQPAADNTRQRTAADEPEEALAGETSLEEGAVDSLGEWEETENVQVNVVTATPDTNGATLNSLSSFFFFWSINDIDQMVNYCAPSWVKKYEDPKSELFGILANRIMKSYTPGTPTGTDNDISRTVPVTATVDKNVNEGESVFIFNVIMLKENENWYVDPMSLKSHEEVEATTFSVIITQPPTPQPAEASMVLYYNPDGGTFYHADPNCPSVDEKYRPLSGTFTYGQINEPAYANLKVCQRCAAPMRK